MITDSQYQDWLRQEGVQRVLLVEANYWDTSEKTIYIASMPFISMPSDTPANQIYDDVVLDTPKFSCSLSDALEGFTIPSWGDILIDNSEFIRDAWLTYGWDGRDVSLLFGDPSWSRSDFRPVLTGTISGISAPSSAQIKMSIKDRQWNLNKPIQTRLVGSPEAITDNMLTYKVTDDSLDSYDANNNLIPGSIDAIWDNGVLLDPSAYTTSPSTVPATFTLVALPVGLLSVDYTGGPASSGQVLPLCYGETFNITPVLLSASLLLYQVHDGAIQEIIEVRDGGIPIAYNSDLLHGKFTLLSQPVGDITCDVKGATSGGIFVEGIARIFRWIILNQTDMIYDDLDSDTLSAFANQCPQRVGIYIKDRRNTLDILDELIKSVGGFYTPNRYGKMIFGQINSPAGTPVMELTADDISFGTLKVIKQSIPAQVIRIAYLRNGSIQKTVHGAVTDANKAIYSQEWSYVKRYNPNAKIAHLLAPAPDAKQTCLVDKTEGEQEADRQVTLNGVVRTTYSADVITLPLTLNMGDVIKMTHPRYGLDGGKLVTILGINESLINRRLTITFRD